MTLTQQQAPGPTETWKNPGRSRIAIRRIGAMGQTQNEMIKGGQTVVITTQERQINQELAANAKLDPFLNGMLQPVVLPDNTDFKRNANHFEPGETEGDLFKLDNKGFSKRIGAMDNLSAIQAILASAEEPATGATVVQLRMLEARFGALQEAAQGGPAKSSAPARDGRPEQEIKREAGGAKGVTPK